MAKVNGDLPSIIFNDESTMLDASESSDSPSLPSLSVHGQIMSIPSQVAPDKNLAGQNIPHTALTGGGSQLMTLREYDTRLKELSNENFQLKVRIYLLEKERTGVTKPEYESAIAKELMKNEKIIKSYLKIIQEKDKEIQSQKSVYQEKLKNKEAEFELCANEKETLSNELTETTSLCRVLMAHLSEFVNYWKSFFPFDEQEANSLMASLLNSTEDLLNSASILIQNDCGNNLQNKSFFGTNLNQLQTTSATGMESSLQLLPDLSQLVEKSRVHATSEQKVPSSDHKSVQTESTKQTSNSASSDANENRNKHAVVHRSSQTNVTSTKNTQTQTETKENYNFASQTSFNNSKNSIGDNEALLKQLEVLRLSKERMERAITKQLHKTDRLLKKAKNNIKET